MSKVESETGEILIQAMLLPDVQDWAFWIVIIGLFGFSVFAFMTHFTALRRWRTNTFLDSYFDRRRERLVDAYFGGGENVDEQVALFVQFPVAVTFGLWGTSALLLKIEGDSEGALGLVGIWLGIAGLIPVAVFILRRYRGPSDRLKPKWLLEEERRREASGEIVRYGRGWARRRSSS